MKKLPLILFIIGIVIASIPVAGQIYTKYKENRMISEWMNSTGTDYTGDVAEPDPETTYSMLQEVFSEENKQNTGTDFSESAEAAESGAENESDPENGAAADNGGSEGREGSMSGASSAVKKKEQKVLGIIQIKKIKLKEPIVEGVGKDNLHAGIGHIPGTAGLGGPGNCALAGHRNYAFKKFFRRLDELEAGDEVIISTKDEEFTYTVTGKSVVKPDDVSVLGGSMDKNVLTLITCTPVYVASHRLIVTAELTGSEVKES